MERYATAYPVQFLQDGYFAELKKAEILRERLDALGQLETYVGTYFSKRWVQKNALNFTDEEIQLMDLEISNENLRINPQRMEKKYECERICRCVTKWKEPRC